MGTCQLTGVGGVDRIPPKASAVDSGTPFRLSSIGGYNEEDGTSMKGTRSALLCLIVALAAGALMAPGASAVEYLPKGFPEIGRCVKTAIGQGTYKAANCQFVARPEYGRYEWVPAMLSEKITFVASGGETTIKTVGHSTVSCIVANIKGEWINEKQAKIEVELQGCTDQQSNQCTSTNNPNNKSEISGTLEGQLGFIKNVEKQIVVGLDLKPYVGESLFTYECGGGPLEQTS